MTQQPTLLTASDVAEILHYGDVRGVHRLIRDGKLAAVRRGNRFLIRPEAVDGYLEAHTVDAGAR